MSDALTVNLSRQIALAREMNTVANNLANMSTNGYQRENLVFSEYVKAADGEMGSLSMATTRARYVDASQGPLQRTDGSFDVAIEGPGFFQIQTPDGVRLTRAGAFTPNSENLLATHEGYLVLDGGAAPIFVPPNAGEVAIAADGTMSIDGEVQGQLGVVTVENPTGLVREADGLLSSTDPVIPAFDSKIAQGFLEGSNVNPISELTRMIDVQRAYELSQSLADLEAERLDRSVQTLGRAV